MRAPRGRPGPRIASGVVERHPDLAPAPTPSCRPIRQTIRELHEGVFSPYRISIFFQESSLILPVIGISLSDVFIRSVVGQIMPGLGDEVVCLSIHGRPSTEGVFRSYRPFQYHFQQGDDALGPVHSDLSKLLTCKGM